MEQITPKTIYPNVDVTFQIYHDGSYIMRMRTFLRKRKGLFGKWYLWKFYREVIVQGHRSIVEEMNHFHSEVYRTLILGKLNAKIVDMHIQPIFEIDPDQTDEKERLIKTGI